MRQVVWAVLAAFFTLIAQTGAQAADHQSESRQGERRDGTVIESFSWIANAYRPHECWEKCRDDFDCRSWSYTSPREGAPPTGSGPPRGTCKLFSDIQRPVEDWLSTSGVGRHEREDNTSRPGLDLRSLVLPDNQECAANCAGDDNCRAYTFEHASNTCFLKRDIPNAVINACCTSGVIPHH